jgi:hypothetical protein
VKLTIIVTTPVEAHLKRLQATGLYGHTLEDVAERLICRALEESHATGLISLMPDEDPKPWEKDQ